MAPSKSQRQSYEYTYDDSNPHVDAGSQYQHQHQFHSQTQSHSRPRYRSHSRTRSRSGSHTRAQETPDYPSRSSRPSTGSAAGAAIQPGANDPEERDTGSGRSAIEPGHSGGASGGGGGPDPGKGAIAGAGAAGSGGVGVSGAASSSAGMSSSASSASYHGRSPSHHSSHHSHAPRASQSLHRDRDSSQQHLHHQHPQHLHHHHPQHRHQHHRRRSSSSSAASTSASTLNAAPPPRPPKVLPQDAHDSSHLAPSSSKRSSSRDGPPPPSDYASATAAARGTALASASASESSRSHRRTSSRPHTGTSQGQHHQSNPREHHRQSSQGHPRSQRPDMSPAAVVNQGGPVATAAPQPPPDPHNAANVAAAAVSASGAKQSRSRTTIPTQSGKWILGKTIGAGSMGKVKIARKEDGGEQVACKIIPRGSTDDGRMSRAERERADQSKEIRTAREAAIVTLLNHPHICGLRDVVRTNYHWYMLFEYVNGGQMLDYIISHGKLKEKQARKFSRQIASALDYCHRNSIVHRDLKIENILISKTGDIKIIDFGLSNLFAPRSHLKTFCGSLYFAAPELLQARAYTGPEVDIWSFGIVLYVLVCGKVPFDDQSMPALHAKIKKGLVDYPNWLSNECKHLMSRMLVTDPKQRATMQEVLTHPWMIKGFNGPPDNYLPSREPLAGKLDPEVISAMQGFNFGSPESIRAQLLKTVESEEYQRAIALYQREKEQMPTTKDGEKKRGFGFDFYKRRNSGTSRDTLTGPSSEALQLGTDPLNAYSPVLSIYYLVKEKQDRDRADLIPPPTAAPREKEKERERDRERDREVDRDRDREHAQERERAKKSPGASDLPAPQAAHTNAATFEMPGEQPTGGRTRPRARTHGEDEAPESARSNHLAPPDTKGEQSQKKEGTAAGLLRRFSTRKRREPERQEKDRSHPPVVQVHTPTEPTSLGPRKSFSIRRGRREREDNTEPSLRSGSSQPQHSDLLSPPMSAGGRPSRRSGGLGRSTSVNSAEMRRRESTRAAKDPPQTSGSDQSISRDEPQSSQRSQGHARSASMRAKSLGHARRESVQRRRLQRGAAQEANVPEETDQDMEQDQSGVSTERLDSSDLAKPSHNVKGLFSVSTTSGKSVPAIRAEFRRVLRLLNVDYTEIKGGFNCRHSPSIDLKRTSETPGSPAQAQTPGHRRRFSFGGLMRSDERDDNREADRPPTTPRTPGRGDRDRSYTNSETSVDSIPRRNGGSSRAAAGETSTQVQSDLGGNMVLEFEVFIVKVPLLLLHGIQFKRMEGNTWQYKNMADQILKELRL